MNPSRRRPIDELILITAWLATSHGVCFPYRTYAPVPFGSRAVGVDRPPNRPHRRDWNDRRSPTNRNLIENMATTEPSFAAQGETRCSYHPSVMTRLRCSRCGKPICPRCGVRTPVGLRCPECAGVRGLPTYTTSTNVLAKAAGAGLAVALVVGLIWGYGPTWGFYLALALGFGVAEAMAWASNAKRGRDLQMVALAIIAFGIVFSRAVMAYRYNIAWEQVNALTPGVEFVLRLRLIPDLLFAVIPFVIGWIRFR